MVKGNRKAKGEVVNLSSVASTKENQQRRVLYSDEAPHSSIISPSTLLTSIRGRRPSPARPRRHRSPTREADTASSPPHPSLVPDADAWNGEGMIDRPHEGVLTEKRVSKVGVKKNGMGGRGA